MSDEIAVVVVEDEPLLRLDIVLYLEDAGFKVYEASNADTAIRILENTPDIRVLFTDIDMPGSMDGLKLAAAVRDRWPPIHIVVTSGHYSPDIGTLPANSRFFPKPYESQLVAAAFREMVAGPLP